MAIQCCTLATVIVAIACAGTKPPTRVAPAHVSSSNATPTATASAPLKFENKCLGNYPDGPRKCTPVPTLADDIRSHALARIPAVRGCYEAALARVGVRSGTLEVGWHIEADGRADCVNVLQDPVGDQAFRDCVVSAFNAPMDVAPQCQVAAAWGYGLTPP